MCRAGFEPTYRLKPVVSPDYVTARFRCTPCIARNCLARLIYRWAVNPATFLVRMSTGGGHPHNS